MGSRVGTLFALGYYREGKRHGRKDGHIIAQEG